MCPHLESLGSVDGPQGPQHSENAEDLHHGDGRGPVGEGTPGASGSLAPNRATQDSNNVLQTVIEAAHLHIY